MHKLIFATLAAILPTLIGAGNIAQAATAISGVDRMETPYEDYLPQMQRMSHWRVTKGPVRAVLVGAHGMQSNKDWFNRLGPQLAAQGVEVWAFNRRGSGLSKPEQKPANATSWRAWVQQFESAGELARRPGVPMVAAGLSWGASAALATVAAYPGDWSGAVLINPALQTRKDANFFWRSGTWLGWWFTPGHVFEIPLDPEDYTTNQNTIAQRLTGDPRILHSATSRMVQQTSQMKSFALKRLAKLDRPVLSLHGTDDELVENEKVKATLRARNAAEVRLEDVPSGTHAAVVEAPSAEIARQIVRWLAEVKPAPLER
ncbi:MAG: acylglycerol lipase [Chthoniobacter sp.]|jgi:alpha-beta hydrolase superfamily lysophospholipase|nr:acylglycerol lipase [Chthoniobacter sp.]